MIGKERNCANKSLIMKIQFNADKVKISGPKIDNSYTVTFEVGEYEYDKIKDLPKLNGEIIFVEVKNEIKGIIETS